MAVSHVFTNPVADGTITSIVRPSDWNSAHNQVVDLTGNTVGVAQVTGTNIVFGGSNNVTLSGVQGVNAGTIHISAAAGGGGGSVNVSAGTTSNNLTNFVLADSNGISFGLNGSTITATVRTDYQSAGAYLTTARASNDAVGLNTAQTNVTWTVNSSGISLNAGGYAGTGYTSTTTAGTAIVATHGTNGLSLAFPTIVTNALTSQSNQAASGSNGSFTFQTLSFSNANGISFGTSAGSAITASHNALTTARASTDAIGLNTAQSNVTWTVNSSGLSLDARGYAGTGTTFNGANLSGSMTVNSNGVQLSMSAAAGGGLTQGTFYAQSNTTQSSSGTIALSSLNFAGAGIASVGITNGSVLISVPAGGGAGDGGVSAGVSNLGNTLGSTGIQTAGNFVLVGTNGITLSQSTAAGNATVTIQGRPAMSRFVNEPSITNVGTVMGNSLVSIFPWVVPNALDASNLRFGKSISVASAANNSSAFLDMSISAVIYTLNGSTLSSVASGSNTYTGTWSSNVSASSVAGARGFTLGLAGQTNFPAGEYWVAYHVSTANTATGGAATTALGNSVSMMVGASAATAALGLDPFFVATAASRGASIGLGILSTGATRGTIALSDVTQTGTRAMVAKLWMDARNYTVW